MKYEGYFSETIKNFSDTHNCSQEIVAAIFEYRSTKRGRQRVWEDPTNKEVKKIVKRAWDILDEDNPEENELYWGDTFRR